MLNIKNQETEAAVRKLAQRLGSSLTEAVAVAVQHELQRLETGQAAYLRQMQQAAAQVRAASAPSLWLSEVELYDEAGLPR
jgi:hypothetical protein